MDHDTLLAMLWDFTAMVASRSTLKSIVNTVITSHRDGHLPSPVTCLASYSRLTRCLGRLLGTPTPTNSESGSPVRRRRVAPGLLLYSQFSNKLVLKGTLTIGCMRPGPLLLTNARATKSARATGCASASHVIQRST